VNFEKRVERKIFGPMKQKLTADWVNNFYSSTNIIRVIKSRKR
jgi:hypothetical protein